MANEEQLSILKQGVRVWNKWRKENPEIEIDLSKADLLQAELSGINFSHANLMGSELGLANLRGANL